MSTANYLVVTGKNTIKR